MKLVLFPIETIVRELDFRLLLAGMIAEKDVMVLLGRHTDIYKMGLMAKNATYVGKNLIMHEKDEDKITRYLEFKALGHRLVYLHEEGAPFKAPVQERQNVLLRQFNPEWIDKDDHVCFWGREQHRIYAECYPDRSRNFHITGHPRFQLCRKPYSGIFEDEVREIRSQYGAPILIDTNFAAMNLAKWARISGALPGDGKPWWEPYPGFRNWFRWHAASYGHFCGLLLELAHNFPDVQVVLRPHPSESPKTYESIFSTVPNLHVVTKGSLHAWLTACRVLIHQDCTTGIEAHLHGQNVISYCPAPDNPLLGKIHAGFGAQCRSVEQVVDVIKGLEKGKPALDVTEHSRQAVDELLVNSRADWDSFERLAGLVREVVEQRPEVRLDEKWAKRLVLNDKWGNPEDPEFKAGDTVIGKDYQPTDKFPGLDESQALHRLSWVARNQGKSIRCRYFGPTVVGVTAE